MNNVFKMHSNTEAWNLQLKSVFFSPSWSVCLDESMMMLEKPNCPGWVIVGRKFQ